MLFFSLICFILPLMQTLDLYLSQTSICNSNCTGSLTNPFSNISEGLQTAFFQLQANGSDQSLNIYFEGTFYIIYDSYFPMNPLIFQNWEAQLSRTISITMMPSLPISSYLPGFFNHFDEITKASIFNDINFFSRKSPVRLQ